MDTDAVEKLQRRCFRQIDEDTVYDMLHRGDIFRIENNTIDWRNTKYIVYKNLIRNFVTCLTLKSFEVFIAIIIYMYTDLFK